jgi:glycosyltransferase involved in cell wall biosynthesis
VHYHHTEGPPRGTLGMAEWLQRNAEEVAAVVRRVRPAVLHAHSDFLNLLTAREVGRATGLPVVYEARGFWEESWLSRISTRYGWTDISALEASYALPEAYTWRREREVDARAAADHVITLSAGMARHITAAGLPSSRITLAPNAVRADDFASLPRDEALARDLGVGDHEVVIGYISSLVEYEGIHTLIEAFELARRRTPVPLRLVIVGDGAERGPLQDLAHRLGVHGAVFTGRVPHAEVGRYYSLIDIFVVPRTARPVRQLVTPLKPFEAFASGRTVVFSDVESLRDIAEESNAAALFEAENPQALAGVLVELLESPQRRRALAQAGYDWVRRDRTWEVNAAAYQEVYAALGVMPAEAPAVEAG